MRPAKYATPEARLAARREADRARKSAVRKNPREAETVSAETPVVTETLSAITTVSAETQVSAITPVGDRPSPTWPAFSPVAVPADVWVGAGRGSPRQYKGDWYVLVSRSPNDDAAVALADYDARLPLTCAHGLQGWQCHAC